MKKETQYIIFEDCIECDNKLWIFTYKYNALCVLDMEKETVVYVSSIPGEELRKERLVSKMISYNNDIILLPMRANNINIYHVESNIWDKVELPVADGNYDLNYKFMEAVVYGQYLYMIGCSYPGIIQLDVAERKAVKVLEYDLNFSKNEISPIWVRSNYVQKERKLYLASCVSNEILKLDLDNFNSETVSLGNDKNRYSGIGLDHNGVFWLSPLFNTNIVKWDGADGYNEISYKAQYNEGFFSGIVILDKIKILPRIIEGDTVVVDEDDNISTIKKVFHMFKKINNDCCLCEDLCGNCYFIKKNMIVKKISALKVDDSSAAIMLKKGMRSSGETVYLEDGLFFNLASYAKSINL